VKKLVLFLIVDSIVVFSFGCSAHSPFILHDTCESTNITKVYPFHTNEVLITEESLPIDVFEIIAAVDVGDVWRSSYRNVRTTMADTARQLGADAVIDVKLWYKPGITYWVTSQGSGVAVKIIDESFDIKEINGFWY